MERHGTLVVEQRRPMILSCDHPVVLGATSIANASSRSCSGRRLKSVLPVTMPLGLTLVETERLRTVSE